MVFEPESGFLDLQSPLGRARNFTQNRNPRGARLAIGRNRPPPEIRILLADSYRIPGAGKRRLLFNATGL